MNKSSSSSHDNNWSEITVPIFLIFSQMLFGLNYTLSKVIVETISIPFWTSLRLLLAGGLLLFLGLFSRKLFGRRSGSQLNWPTLKSWLPLTALWTLQQALQISSVRFASAADSAILHTFTPAFALLVAVVFHAERLTRLRLFGFAIASAGALLIQNIQSFSFSSNEFFGQALALLSSFLLGAFIAFSRPFLQKNDPLWSTGSMLLGGGVLFGATAYLTGSLDVPTNWTSLMSLSIAGPILTSACLGQALPYFVTMWGIQRTRASYVAIFFYVQPLVGALIALTWFDESLSIQKTIAIALVITGVTLATRPDRHLSKGD